MSKRKQRRSPVYVLGTGLSHDGSACLLRDGQIAVAIQKERLTGRKHDGGNDTAAIEYCLEAEGLSLSDVDLVVQNANFSNLSRNSTWFRGPRRVAEAPEVITVSHHLAHAYSVIGTAPFDEMAVLVVDGCGSSFADAVDLDGAVIPDVPHSGLEHLYFEKDSFYLFQRDTLRPTFKDFSPWGMRLSESPFTPPTTLHSIGGVYAAASKYAALGDNGAGKLMGLAPWGRPSAFNLELFRLEHERVFVKYGSLAEFDRPARDFQDFKTRFQYFADVARWVQDEVERALFYLVRHRVALSESTVLGYAGGVALNAVANRRLATEIGLSDFYVPPAAGDGGIALGCAYYGWLAVLGRERVPHDGSDFHGREWGKTEDQRALEGFSNEVIAVKTADLVEDCAKLLADGAVVGWYQGRSEFGPRALGHRSILADARVKARQN